VRGGEVVCTTQQQPFAVRWTANTVSRPTMNHTHTHTHTCEAAGPHLHLLHLLFTVRQRRSVMYMLGNHARGRC
jgi:hypothetical protein